MENGSHESTNCGDFERAVQGARLATAEITYWMPDHPNLLQSFIWQHYDLAPEYPAMQKFLEFWKQNIEATLHSVRISAAEPYTPSRIRTADVVYRLH